MLLSPTKAAYQGRLLAGKIFGAFARGYQATDVHSVAPMAWARAPSITRVLTGT
jgi:hypothetical protein